MQAVFIAYLFYVGFYAPQAQAEYRVFELVITNSTTGQERVEISTLDPNQYRTYFAVRRDESVLYRATWMCKGNTAFKPVCSRPETEGRPSSPPPSLDPKSPR